jgi:hypothetical protein
LVREGQAVCFSKVVPGTVWDVICDDTAENRARIKAAGGESLHVVFG